MKAAKGLQERGCGVGPAREVKKVVALCSIAQCHDEEMRRARLTDGVCEAV